MPRVESADASPCPPRKELTLLRESVTHLEHAMHLLAEATLLDEALDESLGIEAQRLIGVRSAVLAEITSMEQAAP